MTYFAPWMLALLATLGTASGDVNEATRTGFLRGYAAASAKIRSIYEHARIECREIARDGQVSTWTQPSRGQSTRLEFVEPHTKDLVIVVTDPDLSFLLRWVRTSSSFVVADRDLKPAPAVLDLYKERTWRVSLPASAPFQGYFEKPVAEFLADKNCTIKAIARLGEAPNRIIRVDWEMADADEPHKGRYGTFEFLPDVGWVLKSYATYFAGGGYKDPETGETFDVGRGGDLEYRDDHAGVPLVHKVTVWTGAQNRGEGPVYEVTRIAPGPVPKSRFTIESFPVTALLAPATGP